MVNQLGLPEEMLSDNGTNFVGVNKELRELVKQMTKDSKVNESLIKQGVKWTFNPPYAPHFGSVFETMIKAAKRAIIATLVNADITDEELLTAFTGAVFAQFETIDLSVSESRRYYTFNSKPCIFYKVRWVESLHQQWIKKHVIIQRRDGDKYKS